MKTTVTERIPLPASASAPVPGQAPGDDAALAPHPPLGRYYATAEAKRKFVGTIFDQTAGEYDRIERMMAFGSGPWYRRQALRRAGLAPGMKCLDVAVGTGLVAREAVGIVGAGGEVMGIDPSTGMLAEAARALPIRLVVGRAEQLPFEDDSFDFLSMGYALRHVGDLAAAFGEFARVLRPGGVACVLEITRPRGRIPAALVKCYLRGVVPCLARMTSRVARERQRDLWAYYWDTIDACIPPEALTGAMAAAGFGEVKRHVELGLFSEYTGRKL
jgi:demethylmenaquinone methyltransferase / 2-methoxy-6-polyprenyl-1,4-benzoquinol methylase